jgi:hypothetical protein
MSRSVNINIEADSVGDIPTLYETLPKFIYKMAGFWGKLICFFRFYILGIMRRNLNSLGAF